MNSICAGQAQRSLWAALLLGAASWSVAQRDLPKLAIEVDGQSAPSMSPALYTDDQYLLPVGAGIRAILPGAIVRQESPKWIAVEFGGRTLVRIPLKGGGDYAEVYGPSRTEGTGPSRIVPMRSDIIEDPGRQYRNMIDIEDLASIFGTTFDIDATRIALYTTAYWAREVGIGDEIADRRRSANLPHQPDFGISPPAASLSMWVRPPRPSFVQIYKIENGRIEPIFHKNPILGDTVDHAQPGYKPVMRAAQKEKAVRAASRFFGIEPGLYGSYVALVTTTDFGYDDPLQAIREGKLADDDWSIVGFRQRVVDSPIRFESVLAKAGDTLESIASTYGLDPSLLANLNGYRADDVLQPGQRIVVVAGIDEQAVLRQLDVNFEVTGVRVARFGDTVESLAQRCRVDAETFLSANASIPIGGEVVPGEMVNLVRKKGSNDRPEGSDDVEVIDRVGRLTVQTPVREGVDPNSKVLVTADPSNVRVIHKLANLSLYFINVDEFDGYVPMGAVLVRGDSEPVAYLGNPQVAQVALRYLGTPYKWGGNKLESGIDCSHFVSGVFAQLRQKAPSPPVANQEDVGTIVHWKPGPYFRQGKPQVFTDPMPSFSKLAVGDRIIVQRDTRGEKVGSRHTGVYIGELRNHAKFGNVKNAVVHASSSRGVTVDNLPTSHLWKDYRFSLRDSLGSVETLEDLLVAEVARILMQEAVQ